MPDLFGGALPFRNWGGTVTDGQGPWQWLACEVTAGAKPEGLHAGKISQG